MNRARVVFTRPATPPPSFPSFFLESGVFFLMKTGLFVNAAEQGVGQLFRVTIQFSTWVLTYAESATMLWNPLVGPALIEMAVRMLTQFTTLLAQRTPKTAQLAAVRRKKCVVFFLFLLSYVICS